jgi:hypothetical protein
MNKTKTDLQNVLNRLETGIAAAINAREKLLQAINTLPDDEDV